MHTPASIRETAERHHAQLIEFAEQRGDGEEARSNRELATRIIDAALALPAGALLDVGPLTPQGLSREDAFLKTMKVIPFMLGTLRLVEMEFAHETLGVVPYAIVCQLFKDVPSVTHEGLELTAKDIFLQYRRLPLDETPKQT
jgi:hypothetical protein